MQGEARAVEAGETYGAPLVREAGPRKQGSSPPPPMWASGDSEICGVSGSIELVTLLEPGERDC